MAYLWTHSQSVFLRSFISWKQRRSTNRKNVVSYFWAFVFLTVWGIKGFNLISLFFSNTKSNSQINKKWLKRSKKENTQEKYYSFPPPILLHFMHTFKRIIYINTKQLKKNCKKASRYQNNPTKIVHTLSYLASHFLIYAFPKYFFVFFFLSCETIYSFWFFPLQYSRISPHR